MHVNILNSLVNINKTHNRACWSNCSNNFDNKDIPVVKIKTMIHLRAQTLNSTNIKQKMLYHRTHIFCVDLWRKNSCATLSKWMPLYFLYFCPNGLKLLLSLDKPISRLSAPVFEHSFNTMVGMVPMLL